jgi:hypothetical protein
MATTAAAAAAAAAARALKAADVTVTFELELFNIATLSDFTLS